jgi:hypothetical protein
MVQVVPSEDPSLVQIIKQYPVVQKPGLQMRLADKYKYIIVER